MNLAITVDNEVSELYADGTLLPQLAHFDEWRTVDTVVIPAGTNVIALQARDTGVSSSLLRIIINYTLCMQLAGLN